MNVKFCGLKVSNDKWFTLFVTVRSEGSCDDYEDAADRGRSNRKTRRSLERVREFQEVQLTVWSRFRNWTHFLQVYKIGKSIFRLRNPRSSHPGRVIPDANLGVWSRRLSRWFRHRRWPFWNWGTGIVYYQFDFVFFNKNENHVYRHGVQRFSEVDIDVDSNEIFVQVKKRSKWRGWISMRMNSMGGRLIIKLCPRW